METAELTAEPKAALDKETQALRCEALAFGHCLVGKPPSELEIQRYIAAQPILFPDAASPREERLLAYCRKHPAAVAYLDAAQGVLGPENLLRKKILAMTAILETTPQHSEHFLSRDYSRLQLLARLGWTGFRAVLRVLLGIPLLKIVGH